MEFKVKKDFLLVLWFNLLLFFFAFMVNFFTENPWVFIVSFVIFVGPLILFDAAAISSTCKVTSKKLVYTAGAFKYDINLENVVKVERSKNLHPSLALTIDRVRIVTMTNGKQKVYYVGVEDNDKLVDVLNNSITKKDTAKAEAKAPATKTTTTKKTTTATKKITKKEEK